MRYEVEDAGGGCCLGPEVVVVRADDGRACVQVIQARQGARRKEVALRLVRRAIERLGIGPGDALFICRGDLFDPTAVALVEGGFQVERGPVSEDAHRLAEAEHLRRLGAILGFHPRVRDRRYAALNMMLRAEAERRPALRRHWKTNVRRPPEWADAGPAGDAGGRTEGAAQG